MKAQIKAEMLSRFKKLGGKTEGREWIAWKVVTSRFASPNKPQWSLTYIVGETLVDPEKANSDPRDGCGAGLNVHAAPAASMNMKRGQLLLECRVYAANVACVPDGARKWQKYAAYYEGPKFRVRRLRVIASYKYVKGTLVPIRVAAGYEVVP